MKQNTSNAVQEAYQMFFDTKAGLIPGTLRLEQDGQETGGEMEIFGNTLELVNVTMNGSRREFRGTIALEDEKLTFRAEGEVEDGILEMDVKTEAKDMRLTGFLKAS
ncbi:MAG: hypothetical protein ACI4PM_03525 [Butyricicoccus sp.]